MQTKAKKPLWQLVGGFTLVELMMVVAILGILMSLALPFYALVQAKSRRTEIFQVLSGVYEAELSYFTTANTYASMVPVGGQTDCSGPPLLWPRDLQVAGFETASPGKFYGFCIDIFAGPTFVARAAGNVDRDVCIDQARVDDIDREPTFTCDDIADTGCGC